MWIRGDGCGVGGNDHFVLFIFLDVVEYVNGLFLMHSCSSKVKAAVWVGNVDLEALHSRLFVLLHVYVFIVLFVR